MSTPEKLQIERIQKTVADFYKMPLAQMKKLDRKQPDSHQRQVAMFLSRKLTGASYDLIGECFNRDHTTIVHAWRVILVKSSTEGKLAGDMLSLMRILRPELFKPLDRPSNYGKGPTVY